MNILILGSVAAKIPPQGQAAIEKLVYYQAKGLAKRGHKITLIAMKGSEVVGENITLVEVGEGESLTGTGSEGKISVEELYGASYKMRLELVKLTLVIEKLEELKDHYDVVLNNIRGGEIFLPDLERLHKPFYDILHLPLFPQLVDLLNHYQAKVISISDKQQKVFPNLDYAGTVYNGVDPNEYSFSDNHKGYLLYLGSIGANKNPKDAVQAALQSNEKLLIGGRIKDKAYFDKEIAPFIDGDKIVWIGEKKKDEVIKIYQGAKAFLFPTQWEEPFGLVLIEALSCGTPVIAYPNGAIPEIVEEGICGYMVHNVSEMIQKIKEIDKISRKACRKIVEDKFSIEKMIDQYEFILSH